MYQFFIFDSNKILHKLVKNLEIYSFGPIKLDFYPYEIITKTKNLSDKNNTFCYENLILDLNILIVDEERQSPFLANMSSSYGLVLLSEIILRLEECCSKINWEILEIKKFEQDFIQIKLKVLSASSLNILCSQSLVFKAILDFLLNARGLLIHDTSVLSDNSVTDHMNKIFSTRSY